jgi:ATP-dependent exoDNAse (exonuclease V) alpha subunit
LFRRHELPLAVGDRVRVTRNGRSKDNRRLDNGAIYTIRGFTAAGDIQLDTGAVIGRAWGHLAFGYCVTSHASQGRTVDRVFVALGSESFAAASAAQFYVSVSRGREAVTVYTDDKPAVLRAIGRVVPRLTATELVRADERAGWRAWVARRLQGVRRAAAALGLGHETERVAARAMER